MKDLKFVEIYFTPQESTWKSGTSENINYAEYLAENIDKTLQYAEYLAENIDKSIDYSDYIAKNLNYSQKSSEKIGEYLSKYSSYLNE